MKSRFSQLLACCKRSPRRSASSDGSGRVHLRLETLECRTMPSAMAGNMNVLVPAYIYPTPGGAWDQMAVAASKVSITAILTPDSGPGSGVDSNYVAAVNKLKAAGGRVIGYVHTSYDDGSISLAS